MPATINVALAVKLCDLAVDEIDIGDDVGTLEIYDEAQPTNPTIDFVSTPLVIWELPFPAFEDAQVAGNGATALMNEVDPVLALENGTARSFRITSRDGVPLIDGSISDTSGTGMLKLSSVTVVKNVNVVIDSLTITQRAY